jgi:hypothetical protein
LANGIDKSGWLSRWPDFFPRKPRERRLSFLTGMNLTTRTEDGSYLTDIVFDYEHLKELMFLYNLDVYVWKFVGKNGFKWFSEVMDDEKATVNMANSSRTVVSIALKGPRGRVCKILSTATWGWRKEPTEEFLDGLWNIFSAFNFGVHPSPGSLGQNAIKSTLAETQTRYVRPGNNLRKVIFGKGSGGRADEFDDPQIWDEAWQFDFDNHYATVAQEGVPAQRPQIVGLHSMWRPVDMLEEFRTAFCEVRVTVPEVLQVAPFYIRDQTGQLHWIKEPGVYEWWMWKEMIQCCIDAGCTVEVGYCYCWKELDYFLNPFIEGALEIRDYFKRKGMKLEEKMTKSAVVSAFGSFGMRPFDYHWW